MRNHSMTLLWALIMIQIVWAGEGCLLGDEKSVPSRQNDILLRSSPVSFQTSLTGSQGDPQKADSVVHPSKSKAKAFFLSFILPGAGEYYAGSQKTAGVFLGTEALLWSTYFSFRIYGNWKKQDYQIYAVSHAGVRTAGKDHKYYVAMENYNSLHEYNEAKLRQRNLADMYPENAAYDWRWDKPASRERFASLRVESDRAFNRSLFVIGGIFVNHLISGIDAVRLAKKAEERREKQIQVGVAGLPEGGVIVSLWKLF